MNLVKYVLICLLFSITEIKAQSYYMHEAAEDSDGVNMLYGLLGLIILFSIAYLYEKFKDDNEKNRRSKEREDAYRDTAKSMAKSTIEKNPDISKFQNITAWQEGFIEATYDISYNKVKNYRSLDILKQEYDELKYINNSQANMLLREIGYVEKLEFNRRELAREQEAKCGNIVNRTTDVIVNEEFVDNEITKVQKEALQNDDKIDKVHIENTEPIELDGFILSADGKTIIKGKSLSIIEIPEGVEKIESRAFNHLKIKELIIPSSVKEIGEYAFSFTDIEMLCINHPIPKIGESAFIFCEKLREVVIAEGVDRLGVNMFSFCKNLKNVSLPTSLRSIPEGVFNGCEVLESINIPTSVKTIFHYAFSRCMFLKEINFPDGLQYIGDGAFFNCLSLNSIILPDSLRIIGEEAFCDCENIEKVIIPNSVLKIGYGAFRDCFNLKSIVLPQSIIGIEGFTFFGDYQLDSIVLPDNLTCIMSNAFVNLSSAKLNIIIPPSVTHIEPDAFVQCKGIKISVPRGKRNLIEFACKNCDIHIEEYDLDKEYIMYDDLQEKTNRFLLESEMKEKERWKDLEISLGFSTNNNHIDFYDF